MKRLPEARTDNIVLGLEPDGLECPPIKPHTQDKLFIVGYYLKSFMTAMAGKYANLVFVDLFSGAGRNQLSDGNILEGSPLIAARTRPTFTKLILADENPTNVSALEARLRSLDSAPPFETVTGDCNQKIDEILSKIPPYRKGSGVLTVCLVDPFDLSIEFETLRRFKPRYVDFIVLIADSMVGRRDPRLREPDNPIVAQFLGDPDWRKKWEALQSTEKVSFQDFLTMRFKEGMKGLGLDSGNDFRATPDLATQVGLYWLSLFSREPLAIRLWNSAVKNAPRQGGLFA